MNTLNMVLGLGLSLMGSVSAFAMPNDAINCTATGATYGITQITAAKTGFEGQINSQVTYNKNGKTIVLPHFNTTGSLNGEIEIVSKDTFSTVFSINHVYLVATAIPGAKANDEKFSYALVTRKYCDFYHQEEYCSEGQLLETIVDSAVTCALSN